VTGISSTIGGATQVGFNDRGHSPFTQRDPHRAIDEVAYLRWRRGLLNECARHVPKHAHEIDFLLIMAADGVTRLLSGDR
jgi:hypothetical protein